MFQPARREIFQVIFHHHGRFHQQPRHADGVWLIFFNRSQDFFDRLLDAQVDDFVAVVRQNDVDQVLADVMNIALHRGQNHGAFLRAFDFLHKLFKMPHAGLHALR